MDYSSKTRALSSLVKDIKSGKFTFDSPLQREEKQWSPIQRSELIDSILIPIPLDPIRVIKRDDGTFDVIDGKQRMTNIRDFMNDGYALSKTLSPVEIDGAIYEIAGKKYSKLDEIVQDKIKSYEIVMYIFTDAEPDKVRLMFKRQNSGGKALNQKQLRVVWENEEMSKVVYSIANHPFMHKVCTKAQFKNDTAKDIARQTIMLIETNDETQYTSFRTNDMNAFIVKYQENIQYDKIDILKQAMDKLDKEFIEEKLSINISSVPMMLYSAYAVVKNKKSFTRLVELINDFIIGYGTNDEYKALCDKGTSGADKVGARLDYWKSLIKSA